MTIQTPRQGDPLSRTSQSAGWLSSVADAINGTANQKREVRQRRQYITANSMQCTNGFSGGQSIAERSILAQHFIRYSDGVQEQEAILQERINHFGRWSPQAGRLAVCTEGTEGFSPFRVSSHGFMEAHVKFTHGGHEFADVDQRLSSDIVTPARDVKLISSSFGSCRIHEVEAVTYQYPDEASRVAETGRTVTQQEIDDGDLFAEGGITHADRRSITWPMSYWRATGTAGSVVWVEADDVVCLIEKSTYSLPPVEFLEDATFTADTQAGPHTETVNFRIPPGVGGTKTADVGQLLMVYQPGTKIHAYYPAQYHVRAVIDFEVSAAPSGSNTADITLEILGGLFGNQYGGDSFGGGAGVSEKSTLRTVSTSAGLQTSLSCEAVLFIGDDSNSLYGFDIKWSVDSGATIRNLATRVWITPVRWPRVNLVGPI